MKTIVLGGECFWCIEAVYQRVKGVEKVVSGYAGGDKDDPTYHDHADHAEVIQVTYDPKVIPLDTILDMFFYTHDPTTKDRQGNDVGTQYRSIALVSEDEVEAVKAAMKRAESLWDDPLLTEIKVLDKFYEAEDYHQDYYNQNKEADYCQVIINPKIAKFEKKFADYLKALG